MRSLFMSVLLALAFSGAAAQELPVSFHADRLPYTPTGFYLDKVVDDRSQPGNGNVDKGAGKSERIVFNDDITTALRGLVDNGGSNNGKKAVDLHIMMLNITIGKSGAMWQVNAVAVFAFYIDGRAAMQYTRSNKGTTPKDPAAYVEQFIREVLTADLKELDKWYATHQAKTTHTGRVRVNVSIGRRPEASHLMVYSLQRPLQIGDFRGRPDASESELAATVSGMALSYTSETSDDEVVLNITVTPYFDISKSFFKNEGKNARVLAHEQAHFDLTAIRTCQLVDEIKNAKLTPENYETLLEQIRKSGMEQLGRDQDTYDRETNHGIITAKQQEWQDKIAAEVRSVGCY